MEAHREQAYRFLLSAAMLHLKWDLGCLFGGSSWQPWRLWHQVHNARRAACRAYAFHNLACFATWDFEGFSEHRFWRDVEQFSRSYPECGWSNYRGMFEAVLRGEKVPVVQPGGGVPIVKPPADAASNRHDS